MADTSLALKVPLGSPADLYRNYAGNPDLAARAKRLVTPMLENVRRNRVKYDRLAYRRYNQWALVTDDRFYLGRANSYIPAVRRGVERGVSSSIRETFPNDEWWGIEATAPEFEQNVDGQKALMRTQLQRQMNVKRKARPLYRQAWIYGTSIAKVPWRYTTRNEAVPEMDPTTRQPVVRRNKRVLYDGPDFIPVDYFSFHTYPLTVMDVTDARMVAEDMVVEYDELRRDKANYANVQEAKAGAGSGTSGSQALQQRQMRLQQLGITEDELRDSNFVFLTECYVEFDFKDEFKIGPEPAIVTLAWENVVVRLQRNAYGRPPYFVMKDAEMVNEFMAHPRTEATDRLQIILNDMMNQHLDAATFANNPICAYDPAYEDDMHAISIYPGAKIPIPPDAIKFDRPPEAAFSQKEMISFMNGMIGENLGTTPATSASPAGATGQPRGARTFGGMQMMQMLAGSEIKEFVEFQEDAFWEPLLAHVAWLNATFLSDARTLKLAGRKGAPLVVNRETFKGDYAYEWLGTTTMQNQTVRSSQMLVSLNIAKGINPAIFGVVPNLPFMFGEFWKAQGLKGADKLFLNQAPPPVDPQVENQLVAVGRAIEVSPQDNDAEHIVAHSNERMRYAPDDPRHQALLNHEQAHYHSFLMKQQAQAAAQARMMAGPQAPPPRPASVILKGNLSPQETAHFAGGNGGNGGPAPAGDRAGVTPTMAPQSGFGPARAMAGAPGGV